MYVHYIDFIYSLLLVDINNKSTLLIEIIMIYMIINYFENTYNPESYTFYSNNKCNET